MKPHFAWLLRAVDRQMTGVYWRVNVKIGLHSFVSLGFPWQGIRHWIPLLCGVLLWLILVVVVTRWSINEIISSLSRTIVIRRWLGVSARLLLYYGSILHFWRCSSRYIPSVVLQQVDPLCQLLYIPNRPLQMYPLIGFGMYVPFAWSPLLGCSAEIAYST